LYKWNETKRTLTKNEKGLVKFHSYTRKEHSQQTKNQQEVWS